MKDLPAPSVPPADEPSKPDFFRTFGIAALVMLAGAAAAYFLMRNARPAMAVSGMRGRARLMRKDARKLAASPATAEVAGYLSGYADRLEDHADELEGYLEPSYVLER